MRILLAVLCEHASERPDGRIDVEGVFHQLYAPGFPAQQDELMLSVVIEWEEHERGQIHFSIDMLDPSRSPALSVSGHTEVGGRLADQGPPQTRVMMPLQRVVFPVEGTYLFELVVGEHRQIIAPLHLIRNGPPN
ncbi:MAG TPA: hypothetical protein VE913_05655 [Longimicrobium sp.]|nr:hypothetical protein [Longimicrobium sp.]